VFSGKTKLVVAAIDGEMLLVTVGELFEGSLDGLHAAGFAHHLGRDVGVESGAVPVAWDGLWMEGDFDAEFFCDTVEEVTGHPEVVTHFDANTGSDLEFPLRWKDLGVDTRDLDTGVQTTLVVGFDYVAAVDVASSDGTIVGALWTGETTLWPAVGPAGCVKEGVFLLETEPRDLVLVGLHVSVALMAVIVLVGSSVWVPGLAENKNVWEFADRIWEDGYWAQVDIGVVSGSLAGGGTVKVPFWKVFWTLWLFKESLCLGTQVAGRVNPDIFGHKSALLVEAGEFCQVGSIGDGGGFGHDERLSEVLRGEK